jgi:release factor glutamine methyltransferase
MRVSGSDASAAAIEVARANAARLRLNVPFEVADGWPGASLANADLVVANLPYVRDDEWDVLQPEIRLYEPRSALTAGADGLDAIRALIAAAPAGTQLGLEHAPAQAAAVRALLVGAETLSDLAGRDRVTLGSVP